MWLASSTALLDLTLACLRAHLCLPLPTSPISGRNLWSAVPVPVPQLCPSHLDAAPPIPWAYVSSPHLNANSARWALCWAIFRCFSKGLQFLVISNDKLLVINLSVLGQFLLDGNTVCSRQVTSTVCPVWSKERQNWKQTICILHLDLWPLSSPNLLEPQFPIYKVRLIIPLLPTLKDDTRMIKMK
jgi:hypothetical protein